MKRRLLQIAPRFPPAIDGVGEHAARLAAELEAQYSIETIFLEAGTCPGRGRAVRTLNERTAQGLERILASLQFDAILLHYSGYGFHPRGTPVWLLKGLRCFLEKTPREFSVFFHELWVEEKPWRSSFYFAPWQRRVALGLRDWSQHHFTSTPGMVRRLGSQAVVAPIPSGLPPIESVQSNCAAPFRALIFGQKHTRERSVRAHRELLRRLEASGGLQSLTLAGRAAGPASGDFLEARRVVPGGKLRTVPDASPEQLATAFGEANLCLSFYPPHLITKSTTAAAAFAQGCPLVLAPAIGGKEGDEYQPQPSFLINRGSAEEAAALIRAGADGTLASMARQALEWYREHSSWSVHAARVGEALRSA